MKNEDVKRIEYGAFKLTYFYKVVVMMFCFTEPGKLLKKSWRSLVSRDFSSSIILEAESV